MYPSIFDSFPVIRTASAKTRRFQFHSVFQTSTVNSDCVYEAEFLKMDFASEKTNFPRIDIEFC